MKKVILILAGILTVSFGAVAQDVDYSHRRMEVGLNVFSYIGNPVAPRYVEKYSPRFIRGAFMKFHSNKTTFRAGYDYFKYHLEYILTEVIVIFDSNFKIDADYNRHQLYVGIEKEFFQSKHLRPFVFSDLGLYYLSCHGESWSYSGWSLQTIYNKIDDNYFGVLFHGGGGLKYYLTENLVLSYETAFSINKNLQKDNQFKIKFNPIHLMGISYIFE